jgi:hypothetical protein
MAIIIPYERDAFSLSPSAASVLPIQILANTDACASGDCLYLSDFADDVIFGHYISAFPSHDIATDR